MAKIRNENQYAWAVSRVEELLHIVDENTPDDVHSKVELELLSDLVSDYSDVHFSLEEPSLADALKLKMAELELSQKDLADMLGVSPSRICEYLSGKCKPTFKIARRICILLKIDPAVVLGV